MNTILHILRRPFQRCRNARGTAAIEVGLTILPFMLAFFGVIEMGMFYFHQHTIQFATHEGMRVGLLGTKLLDTDGVTELDREASIRKAIADNSNFFITIDPSDVDISPVTLAGAPVAGGNAGQLMKVQVDYTHEFVTSLVGGFFGPTNNFVLHAEATYRNEAFLGG